MISTLRSATSPSAAAQPLHRKSSEDEPCGIGAHGKGKALRFAKES